jgi:hypothetical protein
MAQKAHRTRFQRTFDSLPDYEKVTIRCGLNALNDARSAAELDDIALAYGRRQTPGPSEAVKALRAFARPNSSDVVAPKIRAAWEKY